MLHTPVMLSEVLEYLNVAPGKKYIDATLGDGGHSIEILKQGGLVLGLDYNLDSLLRAKKRITDLGLKQNFVAVNENFKNIEEVANQHDFTNVDGILYDLGYSSYHLEEYAKGLSFQKDEPLDMRLDKEMNVTASDLVNALSEKQLEELFSEYGGESQARNFARAIVEARSLKKLTTTKQLVDVIVDVAPPGYEGGRIHPATRVFQALRIIVNDELENLKISLPRAARLLKLPGGRMVIISFHSLEDKVAKQFGQLVRPVLKKPLTPTEAETKQNPRARSAKLRVLEVEPKND